MMNTFQISKFWNLELFEKQSKCKLQLTITIALTGHQSPQNIIAQDLTKIDSYKAWKIHWDDCDTKMPNKVFGIRWLFP